MEQIFQKKEDKLYNKKLKSVILIFVKFGLKQRLMIKRFKMKLYLSMIKIQIFKVIRKKRLLHF